MKNQADQNLLFGVLALELKFISREQFVAAVNAWVRDRTKELSRILVEQGMLDLGDHDLLQSVLERHVRKHGGSCAQSLTAVGLDFDVKCELENLSDVDLNTTLSHIASDASTLRDPNATVIMTRPEPVLLSTAQRFQVLRPHARGGIGVVSVALDSELRREVALKEIRAEQADDPSSRNRFLLEAEVTGRLEHPGVVPVYGLGTNREGRLYYAMRFVRGESLRDAIERFHEADRVPNRDPSERSLELRQLLRRFIDVCNAIAYAHSRGILHRDLKPANILLGPYGETLVVDWGLAKVVAEKDAPKHAKPTFDVPFASDSSETQTGSAVGTPAYMSPEQAEGDPTRLGPASDVYGLGATFYCLITGRPPIEGKDVPTLLRLAQQGRIPPAREINKRVPAALEAVCRKAMAFNPENRYVTARALADDIEHWLADEPVSARREPIWDRARRWMRRHRTWMATVLAAILVAMIGASAVAVVKTAATRQLEASLQREAKANQSAQARFRLALDAVRAYHTGVSEDVLLKEKALESLRTKLLSSSLEFYAKLQNELERESTPTARAHLAESYEQVADLTSEIGSMEKATAPFERALAIREALVAEAPADPQREAALASTLHEFARLQQETGHLNEAIAPFERAHAIRKRLVKAYPKVEKYQLDLAHSKAGFGELLNEIGQKEDAMLMLRDSRDIIAEFARRSPVSIARQRDLASSYDRLGRLYFELGKTDDAKAEYGRALKIRQDLVRREPRSIPFRSELAASFTTIGNLEFDARHNPGEALRAYRESQKLIARIVEESPIVLRFQLDLANACLNVGRSYRETGRHNDAIVEIHHAIQILEAVTKTDPTVLDGQNRLARAYLIEGLVLYDMGRDAESLKAYERVAAMLPPLIAASPSAINLRLDLAYAYDNTGSIYRQSGRPEQALESYRKSREVLEGLVRDDPNAVGHEALLASCLNGIGSVQAALQRKDEALKTLEEARSVFGRLSREHPKDIVYLTELARSEIRIGKLLRTIGRPAEALGSLQRGLAIQEAQHDRTAVDSYNLACTLAECSDLVKSKPITSPPDESQTALSFADRAMAALHDAVSGGFRNAPHFAIDPDLDPLRSRPDFQALMRDLTFPSQPFAK
jgi:serine/threonine-protein kinase